MKNYFKVILVLLAIAFESVDGYAAGGATPVAYPNTNVMVPKQATPNDKNSKATGVRGSKAAGVHGSILNTNSASTPVLAGSKNQQLSKPLIVSSDSIASSSSFTPQTGSINNNNHAGMFEMMTDATPLSIDRSNSVFDNSNTVSYSAITTNSRINDVNPNNMNNGYAYNDVHYGDNDENYKESNTKTNSAIFGAGAVTGAMVTVMGSVAVFFTRKAFMGGSSNFSGSSNKKIIPFKEAFTATRNIKNGRLSTPLMATATKDDEKQNIDCMSIGLPELPWKRDALEPHISQETINYHYDKHHAGYVTKLNAAILGTEYENLSLNEIIEKAEGATSALTKNAHQIWNHTFYWQSMAPNAGGLPSPTGKLHDAIQKSFGSFDNFKKEFSTVAGGHFGSGWAWLISDPDGSLSIVDTHDYGTPRYNTSNSKYKTRLFPLLTCDIWEHAYYIDYRNARPDYIDAWWNVVNWEFAEANYENAITHPLYH